jgi:selenocysteine lyase/cysteine desulfurase
MHFELEDGISYYVENFSREALRYARSETMRKIENYHREISYLEQQFKILSNRLDWLKSVGIENENKELSMINSAITNLRAKND